MESTRLFRGGHDLCYFRIHSLRHSWLKFRSLCACNATFFGVVIIQGNATATLPPPKKKVASNVNSTSESWQHNVEKSCQQHNCIPPSAVGKFQAAEELFVVSTSVCTIWATALTCRLQCQQKWHGTKIRTYQLFILCVILVVYCRT